MKHLLVKMKPITGVAPRAGAWIETAIKPKYLIIACRAPRGRVD